LWWASESFLPNPCGFLNYHSHGPSLLECQGDDYEVYGQIFDSFDELKEYVVEGLDVVINRLTFVRDQVKKADDFESMDLEWWEPLVEKVSETCPENTSEAPK